MTAAIQKAGQAHVDAGGVTRAAPLVPKDWGGAAAEGAFGVSSGKVVGASTHPTLAGLHLLGNRLGRLDQLVESRVLSIDGRTDDQHRLLDQ